MLPAKEGEEEGSSEDNSATPSRGIGTTDLHQLNKKKKQTTIDIFLCSAKEKLLMTKELELNRSYKGLLSEMSRRHLR